MSTRSSARKLFPPLENPELTIRRRSRSDPTLLNNSKMAAEENGDLPIIKVNGVTKDALRLYLFPYSLTHHATAWFDRLPRNSINTFEQMAKMFLGKYFPPSMVTKLRNEITNFRQRPDESLFEARELYKLSIDRCPNHNMLPVTQIDTFYNGLTLRHRDTINAAAGGTFKKVQRSESSSSITSSFDTEIAALKAEMAKINKNLMRVLQEDLKGITTRKGTAYTGPTIPTSSSSPLVESEIEATKDTVHPTNKGSTEDVQPPVVPTESPILNFEPVVSPIIEPVASPVSALRPNQRPSVPYQSRLQAQKLHDKANDQRENFFQIFKDLISFTDAFILMPKFGPSIKSLLTNKDKLCELARTLLNDNCSAILLKKFPEKLGDPDKFLIPCDFPRMAECLALADLGASINLMPLFVWNKLSLPKLSPTCRTLELADHFNADPRAPLILGRSFLQIRRALIDVFEEYSQDVLGFSDVITSGNPTPYYDLIVSTTSSTLTLFGNSDFLLEEVDAFLALEDDPTTPEVDQSYLDSEGDILLLEAFLKDDPSLPPLNQGNYLPEVRKELKIYKAKSNKSSIDEPSEVELKDLPPHLEYAFLKGDDKLPFIIAKDLSVEEKTALIKVLKLHKRAITWKLSDIKGISKFLSVRKIKRKPHSPAHMERLLTAACLLGYAMHRARFREGIEVDKAKVDVITKLHHPTTVKGIRSFLGHVGFYQRFIKDFSKIARPMTCVLKKDTPFHFSKERVKAFQTLKRKLTEAPILIAPDWDMPFELMCDASDFAISAVLGKLIDTKGAENLAADHLSRLENPHQNVLDPKEINESFPLETLNLVSTRGNSRTLWFTDFANYHVWNFVVKGMSSQQKSLYTARKPLTFSRLATMDPPGDTMVEITQPRRRVQLNGLRDQAYENSLIYKEKTKRLHDSKIKDRVFNIGHRVLLFNSRLKIFSDKLKSRWSGPFTISHVFPYGTVELSQPDGPNFKVNGHRLKHYFGEDVPKVVVPDLQTFPKDH
nr:hypothetical protein [Tanacetum cinerariifolium]